MKIVLKLAALVAVGVALKACLPTGGVDLKKENLFPVPMTANILW